jgi:RNA polymerase sigma-70 factor (ECF subfamily)
VDSVQEQAPALPTSVQDDRSQKLEYLMQRFGDQVLKLAYYYVRDCHWAEDIAQEVFCRVYQNLDRFRQESSYFTWIHRITVNLCRDHLRSAAFRRLIPWGDTYSLEQVGTWSEPRTGELESSEIWREVMKLPVKYRVVLALHYFHDLSTRQISAITGMKEGTVRVNLSRARNRLKKNLQQMGVAGHERRGVPSQTQASPL